MCGRFSLGVDTDRLIHEFGIDTVTAEPEPRYNLAPTQDVPAVARGPDGLRLGLLRWGLVPPGSAGPAAGGQLINARAETVSRRRPFRDAFRHRRCWVLADGFYEWRREPDGGRTPIHFRLPGGRPFAFAGLWERWERPEHEPVLSCTILTTAANDAVRPIHDRMPVILPPDQRTLWLAPDATEAALAPLMRPFAEELEAFPVSTRVNSPRNDDPSLVLPADPPGNFLDALV